LYGDGAEKGKEWEDRKPLHRDKVTVGGKLHRELNNNTEGRRRGKSKGKGGKHAID